MRISTLLLIISLLVVGSAIARAGEAATSVPAGQPVSSTVVSLDGDEWLLATDPKNVGREQKWFETPRPEAKPTKVPWIIQDAFPGYHGVAWYWRDFAAPANPHAARPLPAAVLGRRLQGRRVAQRRRASAGTRAARRRLRSM